MRRREAVSGWRLAVSSDAASVTFTERRLGCLHETKTQLTRCSDAGRSRPDYPLAANR
jgi:hypothetical protein